MSISVLTRSFDNCRSGANLQETVLTSMHVQANGIKHLFDLTLADDARGTEGMPLLVAGLIMQDGLAHDVLFTATMANDVYAFDANTGQLLWKQHIANPIISNKTLDMYQIAQNWGILATPVIDPVTATIYVVAMSSPDGLIGDSRFTLHALSLITGVDQAPPLNLNAATYQPPNGLSLSTMGSVPRKQRCGLLFDSRNGLNTVFVANGSFNEDADTNQGWVIACDVTGLRLTIAACWTTTSRYSGGGIWMAGQGPSMDSEGFIYFMIGNGAFDAITDFGESFCKLQYTPKTAVAPASLSIVDWWTPFTDTGRVGLDPTLADTSLGPAGWWTTEPSGTSNMDSPGDEDLNSGGPLLLPMSETGFSKNVIIGAGKDGFAYVVNMDDMGQTALADFAPTRIAGNFAKLLSPPYGFTYYPVGIDLMTPNLATLPTTVYGFTHHQHSTPVGYQSPDHGFMIFTGGENGPVRAFCLNPDFTLTYLACGTITASAMCAAPGGMPGTMMTLSASGPGTNTAVLWCCIPYGDANKTITPGRLVAYGANWIDGNGHLIVLWDSATYGNYGIMHNKFNIPMVCNGKVYVPSYDGRILVFG
jgi:outer membrane protein assembly factor BamB